MDSARIRLWICVLGHFCYNNFDMGEGDNPAWREREAWNTRKR